MTNATDAAEPAKRKPREKRASVAASAAPPKTSGKSTKADAVLALLTRAKGASLDDMMSVTGWQAHSVRGFISGTLKKKLASTVISEKTPKGRIYRIVAEGAA